MIVDVVGHVIGPSDKNCAQLAPTRAQAVLATEGLEQSTRAPRDDGGGAPGRSPRVKERVQSEARACSRPRE